MDREKEICVNCSEIITGENRYSWCNYYGQSGIHHVTVYKSWLRFLMEEVERSEKP